MKAVYIRATKKCFIMIDMVSHYIFAKKVTHCIVPELIYIINDIALVVGMPDKFFYDSPPFNTDAFTKFCQVQSIYVKQYVPNSNPHAQILADHFISLVHYGNFDIPELNKRLWELRSFPVYNIRTFKGVTYAPMTLFYSRFEGDQIYRYAIQPAARSPTNSIGLANIKYVRFPSMIRQIETNKGLKIRYLLLGSSNALALNSLENQDDIYKIVNFTNISIGGLSANRMKGGEKFFNHHLMHLDHINYAHDTDYHTVVILFIGTNCYKNNEYDKYAAALMASVSILANRLHRNKFITMTPLPRGGDPSLIAKQMAIMDKFVKSMTERQLRVVNTYQALPHNLKSPSNLYCPSRHDLTHYSTEVLTVLSTVVANLIKLDIQQLWLDYRNPFDFSTVL